MQKKIIIGLALTLVIIIFIPVYWAMEPGRQEAARERQQAEAVERGSELYASTCATCHGSQGEGNIGPPLKGTQLSDDALERTIIRGVPGTAMVAWGEEEDGPLKKHQLEDLVTFINSLNDSGLPSTPVASPTSIPSSLTPAVISAVELYDTKCSVCHGVNREGVDKLGLPLTPERLDELSDDEIRDTILNGRFGTAMPAFKAILSYEEIDSLNQFIKYTSP